MTGPGAPHAPDDPRDGVVRALLWRLRARLVTPPDAQRARSDLDRILASAAEHAHYRPTSDATTPTTSRASSTQPVRLAAVPALADRRALRVTARFGRVAAAAVLVVGVGGGIGTALDQNTSLLALLRLDEARQPADPDVAATPDPVPADAQDDASGSSAPAAATPGEPPLAVPDGDDTEVSSEPSDGDDADVDDELDRSAGSPGTSDGASAGDAGTGDAPARERSQERGADDEPQDGLLDDTVVAAPETPPDPEGDLDGFGGAIPCEDDDLASCLGDAESVVELDEGDEPEQGPVRDATEDAKDDSTLLEELAERRFQG